MSTPHDLTAPSETHRPRAYPQPPASDARRVAQPDPVQFDLPDDDDDAEQDTDRLFSWGAVLASVGRYYTPPAPWATPPASLEELASYAHVGEWAAPRGVRRGLGIAYWYTVGLPCTVLCRYGEWIAQRPGRLVTVLLIGALLHRTTPGHWVAHALGQVFHYLFLPLTWLY